MSVPLCPDCAAPLTGPESCPACGLNLLGPVAARLWQVDQQLLTLDSQRTALMSERVRLLHQLRTGEAPAATAATILPAAGGPAAPHQRKETSPQQVQNTLLGLGALLLAIAGVVFAAVTYRNVGVVGRAGILITLTAVAATVPFTLVTRRLTASGEAVAAVAVALSAIDAWALRKAGLGEGLEVETYSAVATGLLALAAAAHAVALPLRTSRLAAAVFAQLPVLFVLARTDASRPVLGVTLTALAAVDALVASERRVVPDVRVLTAALSGGAVLGALAASVGAVADHDRGGAWGLTALAALAAAASVRVTERTGSALFAGLTVPLLAAAAWSVARPSLTEPQQPLVLAAVALIALQVSGLLPRVRREGPVLGALAVASVAVLTQGTAILQAVAGPFTWLAHPWALATTPARDALSTEQPWEGTVVTLVLLAAAAGSALAAGALLDRFEDAAVPAGVLLVLSALMLPLGLATSYHEALATLLLTAAVLAGGGVLLVARQRIPGLALITTGFATAVLTCVWSVADQDATLTVLPIAALLAAGLAVKVPGFLTGSAALLAGAELAAYGASQDLAPEQVGGLLLIAPAVCVGLAFLLRDAHRLGVEGAAAVLASTSVILAVEDPGWLSWTLALSGLLCLALAVKTDRRVVGLAGGLLLSASSWVRLADAHVTSPEPYVAPLALAALLFGFLRRRSQPSLSSFAAYGAGLSIALTPSLLKALDDPTPTRGLLLLAVAAGVVLVGGRERLRAPLVIGGAVLAIDALHLLAPYASALPRWTLLAGAGALLVLVGATYEQRLRDMARLRETYEAWR